jgi:mRNA interferase MazF
MEINFWDIFWTDLDPVKWSEQWWLRPVLVFQNTKLNSIFNTIFIIPITSNLKAKWYMLTYFLDKKTSWLDKDSICLTFQPRTISKERLIKKVWNLWNKEMLKIKNELEKLYF